jgi:hypothetical protein
MAILVMCALFIMDWSPKLLGFMKRHVHHYIYHQEDCGDNSSDNLSGSDINEMKMGCTIGCFLKVILK